MAAKRVRHRRRESLMHDLTPRLVAILQKYMRDPAVRVAGSMALSELDIDLFDLPLIYLDVEDAFDVHIGPGDELEEPVTVGDLVTRVTSCLAARALPRVRIPRRKGSWMSTGAERRR
jgi:acyl carrier protein